MAVMEAFGTKAFAGSSTTPLFWPVAFCAMAADDSDRHRTKTRTIRATLDMEFPPSNCHHTLATNVFAYTRDVKQFLFVVYRTAMRRCPLQIPKSSIATCVVVTGCPAGWTPLHAR